MMQLAHPKVAQPKLGTFLPRVCHWYSIPVRHECQTAQLMPGNMRHILAALDVWLRSWRWRTTRDREIPEPARYSPSATLLICLYSFEHSLGIRSFRPIWPCLIVQVHITSIFTFRTANAFGCFRGVIVRTLKSIIIMSCH